MAKGKFGIYRGLRPSGVDFGGVVERNIDKIVEGERLRDEKDRRAAQLLRDEIAKREKNALEAFGDDAYVSQAEYFNEQIQNVNYETTSKMLALSDRYKESGDFRDLLEIKKFNANATNRAASIDTAIGRITDINAKLADSENYSVARNAGIQNELNDLLLTQEGRYKLDMKDFKVYERDEEGNITGEGTNVMDFINQRFSNLKQAVDPMERVGTFFDEVRVPYKERTVGTGKDQKIIQSVNFEEMKSEFLTPFKSIFNADNEAWQEYAAINTDIEPENVAEKMLQEWLILQGYTFESETARPTRVPTEGGSLTATERKQLEERQMSWDWLTDLAGGIEGKAAEMEINKYVTEEGYVEDIYGAETYLNPKTGQIGVAANAARTDQATDETVRYVKNIPDITTERGATQALKLATSGTRPSLVKWPELGASPEQLRAEAAEKMANLPPERREEMVNKSFEVTASSVLHKLYNDIGNTAIGKSHIDQTISEIHSAIDKVLPAPAAAEAKARIQPKSQLIGKGRGLVVDGERVGQYTQLTEQNIGEFISEISRVMRESYRASDEEIPTLSTATQDGEFALTGWKNE